MNTNPFQTPPPHQQTQTILEECGYSPIPTTPKTPKTPSPLTEILFTDDFIDLESNSDYMVSLFFIHLILYLILF
jgi:hypothetical protein